MNRYLKQIIFLSILFIPLLGSGAGYAYTQTTPTVTYNNSKMLDNQIRTKIQQNPNIIFFNKADFTNGTSINVTRNLLVNDWGYTTMNDTIQMIVVNQQFNAFNYSLPLSLFYKVNYLKFTFKNYNTTVNDIQSINSINKHNMDLTFVFNQTATIVNGSVSIILGINDLMSSDAQNLNFPFKISGINFLPFFDFPMTKYTYSGGLQSYSSTKNVDNTTYAPNANNLGLTAGIAQNYVQNTVSVSYSAMNQLSNFNYTSLKGEYQNIGSTNYIPGYENKFSGNFTIPVSFRYTSSVAPLIYTHSQVTITINYWGDINYDEITTLVNEGTNQTFTGSTTDTSVPIFVNAPKVNNLQTSDYLGNLTGSSVTRFATPDAGFPVNSSKVLIVPRSAIGFGSSYTYELKYTIPAAQFMNETSGFLSPAYTLTLPAMSLFNWTNRQVDLKIIFPALSSITMPKTIWGVPVSGANLTNDGFLNVGHPVLVLTLYNFSTYNNVFEKFYLTMPAVIGPFFSIIQNAMYIFIVGLLIIIVRIIMQKYSHIVEVASTEESQIPFDLMREFVTAYEEKTALRSRLSDLEKKKKNLRKVEYDQLVQTLKNKQSANDKKLIGVTANLVKVSAVYKESIRTLELAEAERDQILAQIADLDEKKKQSRIRPEIYNKLKNEQNSRLNKAISRIERVLNELRSLLREAK